MVVPFDFEIKPPMNVEVRLVSFRTWVRFPPSPFFKNIFKLQILLNYTQWRNFEKVINKVKDSCKNFKQNGSNWLRD